MDLHWWVYRGEWVEVESGTIPEEDETIYVLNEGEDPMDIVGEILTSKREDDDT